MFPKYVYFIIYSISLTTGLCYYSKVRGSKARFFLYILLLGLITEGLGYFLGIRLKMDTFLIHNIYKFLSLTFLMLFFYGYIKNTRKKLIVKYILILFILFYILNFLLITPSIFIYQVNSAIFGSLCLIIVILLYLMNLLSSEKVLNIKHVLIFWFAAGSLIYYVVYLPVFALAKFLHYGNLWSYIIFTLNIIMHTFFITGFIVSKKKFN